MAQALSLNGITSIMFNIHHSSCPTSNRLQT